jgi:CRISPR-associated endonuclease/helicase Cas3
VLAFRLLRIGTRTQDEMRLYDIANIDTNPDWTAPETVERYFRELYWTSGAKALDQIDIFNRFGMIANDPSFDYRSVAEEFRMVESFGAPVIIPDPNNTKILSDLTNPSVPSGKIARALQTWIVQPPERDRARLIDAGVIRFIGGSDRADQFAVLQDMDFYKRETGLIWEEMTGIWSQII